MFIETSEPRSALIRCIVDSICNILVERQITLMDYLKELAIIIKPEAWAANCIVLKHNQHFVFLNDSCCDEDLIEIVARIRLRHIRYYDYYNDDIRAVLATEVQLFTDLYKAMTKSCLVGVAL